MTSITRFALAHKRLVAVVWLALAVAGGLTVSSTTGRLTHSFATPGNPGYDTNIRLVQHFGIDGNEQPTIAVLHLPAGASMRTAAGRAAAARTFAAAHRAGHVAVADYASTHDRALVSADGRTTWALINMPNPDTASGSGVIGRIPHALQAAAPPWCGGGGNGFRADPDRWRRSPLSCRERERDALRAARATELPKRDGAPHRGAPVDVQRVRDQRLRASRGSRSAASTRPARGQL